MLLLNTINSHHREKFRLEFPHEQQSETTYFPMTKKSAKKGKEKAKNWILGRENLIVQAHGNW